MANGIINAVIYENIYELSELSGLSGLYEKKKKKKKEKVKQRDEFFQSDGMFSSWKEAFSLKSPPISDGYKNTTSSRSGRLPGKQAGWKEENDLRFDETISNVADGRIFLAR